MSSVARRREYVVVRGGGAPELVAELGGVVVWLRRKARHRSGGK